MLLHFLSHLALVHCDLIAEFVLLEIFFLPCRLLLPRSLLDEVAVEHLMQEGRHASIKDKLGLQFHGEGVIGVLVVLVDVGIFCEDVVGGATAESQPADEADPQPLALVALLAEGDDWRLLVVPAQRTGVVLPALEALAVEVVPAEDGYDLLVDLLEADGAG